jgi:hypothetical protein
MANPYLKFNGKTVRVGSGGARLISPFELIPPYTLRVEFVNTPACQSAGFDPTQGTGVEAAPDWAYGTWRHVYGNVYDWTYTSDTWFVYYTSYNGNGYASPWGLTNGGTRGTFTDRFNTLAYRVVGANLAGVKYIPKLFWKTSKYLVSVALFDTSKIECAGGMFFANSRQRPQYLTRLPDFDFSGIKHDSVPLGGNTTWAVNQVILGLMYFARGTGTNGNGLTSIPNITLPTDTSVNVSYAFSENKEVTGGALNLYNKFTAADWQGAHTGCFSNCGVNTTTGAAELAQIPTGWGGTMSA